LDFEEAEEIINCYNKYIMSKSKVIPSFEKLKALMERLDEKLKFFKHGAFIKLNTRSPKDAPHYDTESERSHSNFLIYSQRNH
jgi:hypothetical protein